MGVTGLHQQLKEIQTPTKLDRYRGKTLAVDTYGWLHRATVSCAEELCMNLPTRKYITSIIRKVEMLRYFGVEPYMVFDGAHLPTKAETAKERRLRREEAQRKADALVKRGNKKLAWKEFMKAAAVTCQMAKSIMVELDRMNVKYIVAPYEADPQMVYLEKIGEVDGILSEDSDLLIFGCTRLITKLNDYGECVEINRNDFIRVKSIASFTPEQLRIVAMLSGCDYTKGIPGVGLKTAFNLVKKYNNLSRVLSALRADGKKPPEDFDIEVVKADLAFQYQKVFNPVTQKLTTLNEYPNPFSFDMELVESCCGITLEDHDTHIQICNGNIHPNSYETLVSREQSIVSLRSLSVHSSSSKPTTIPNEPKIKPMKTLDNFFNKAATVKEVKKDRSPTKEKVSPISKRMKRHINIPQENLDTPVKNLSKFFSSSPDLSKLGAYEGDITGESEVPESSPMTKVNVETILTDTDDDGEVERQINEKERIQDKEKKRIQDKEKERESENSENSHIQDFDIDDDDEIEESPVKNTINKDHFVTNETQIKLALRKTFLLGADPKQKFELNHKQKLNHKQNLDTQNSIPSKSKPSALSEFAFNG